MPIHYLLNDGRLYPLDIVGMPVAASAGGFGADGQATVVCGSESRAADSKWICVLERPPHAAL